MKRPLSRLRLLVLLPVAHFLVFVKATTVHIPSSTEMNRRANLSVRGGKVDTSPVNPKLPKRFVDNSRMPSLFTSEEGVYDKYAACLAATEGLRRLRDQDVAQEIQRAVAADTTGGSVDVNEAQRHITAQYVQNAGKVLRALGMSINQFNELGRQIAQDKGLKEKVVEQAYLYRMAATINMDRAPLIEDPTSEELLRAFRRDKVQLFCESMTEIETMRSEQIKRLQKALHVDKFPPNVNISDPNLAPFLSAKVRAVVEAFPFQAEEIVKKHGLQSDEFNQMLMETRSNPIFRWKIQKQMRTGHQHEEDEPEPRPDATATATEASPTSTPPIAKYF